MCNFWAAILTKDMKVVWGKDATSHEELIIKEGLKDDKLENRNFVRIEITPKKQKDIFSKKKSDWNFRVDEEGTLPKWFSATRHECEAKLWREWASAMEQTLWQLETEAAGKFLESVPKIPYLKFTGEARAEWHLSLGVTLAAARAAARDAAWDAAGAAARDAARDAAGAAAGAAARDAAGAAAGAAAGDAARDAAWDAAGAAARDAARDAARAAARDAAGAAARAAARDAAWDAAGAAAGAAARAAARDAAWDAAGAAARDAALFIQCLLASKLNSKHMLHTKARMDVWQQGYALWDDVNGKLYVYGIKKK